MTVTVIDPTGRAQLSRHLFAVGVTLETPSSSQIVHARGVGFFQTPIGAALGYHDVDLAVLGRECRAVFWMNTAEQARDLAEMVRGEHGVCVAERGGEVGRVGDEER